MAAEQSTEVVWEHDLQHGQGNVTVGSGALPKFPVSWAHRIAPSAGKTSPEELLAAAHASCFSMALAAGLGRMQMPPERIRVVAKATFDKVGEAWRVTKMELDVTGKVPKITAPQFEEAVQNASKGCPISQALQGNVPIHATARLE